jgi:hypothetical protein
VRVWTPDSVVGGIKSRFDPGSGVHIRELKQQYYAKIFVTTY